MCYSQKVKFQTKQVDTTSNLLESLILKTLDTKDNGCQGVYGIETQSLQVEIQNGMTILEGNFSVLYN
jgi:hypothetical protein